MAATLEEIQAIVAVQLGRRSVGPDDRIIEDLGGESLDVVNIIAAIEDRYGIRIEEQELPDLQTAKELFERVGGRAVRVDLVQYRWRA